MGMAEKCHQKNVELIQQAVPEPVTTAAIVQRKGQMGANLTGEAPRSSLHPRSSPDSRGS